MPPEARLLYVIQPNCTATPSLLYFHCHADTSPYAGSDSIAHAASYAQPDVSGADSPW